MPSAVEANLGENLRVSFGRVTVAPAFHRRRFNWDSTDVALFTAHELAFWPEVIVSRPISSRRRPLRGRRTPPDPKINTGALARHFGPGPLAIGDEEQFTRQPHCRIEPPARRALKRYSRSELTEGVRSA